ncbi:hypothetical protein [Carnobacterium divergens]|uniref:hypothetical protein n=1 Tax=Carnobacterium divergens TaxID=2748 RepID=UPI00288F11FA|nr:hypothetical protein [Carnobacterium divergens]MDT2010833.1 hypothetical protein [Carnobacterium divergens]
MESLYIFLKNENLILKDIKSNIAEISSNFDFKQTFEFSLSKNDLIQNLTLIKNIFKLNNCINIYVNDFEYYDGFNTESLEELNNISIIIKIDIFDENKNFNSVTFLNILDFKDFLKYFANTININNCTNIRHKMKISFIETVEIHDINLSDSIFDLKNDTEFEILDGFILDNYYSHKKIISLPYVIPKVCDDYMIELIIQSYFELLVTHYISNENLFILNSTKSSSFELKDINFSELLLDELAELITFIFEEKKHSYDKLEIFKNLLSREIFAKKKIDNELINNLFNELKEHYSIFINDSVMTFIKDKQKITDDYLKIAQSISKNIKVISDDVQKQCLTVIGIILSTFFIKGLDKGINNLIIPVCGLIYVIFILWINFKKGWNSDSKFYEKEIQFINDRYKEIYRLNSEYVKNIEEEYIQPKINHLKSMEIISENIYFAIAFLFILWISYI